MSRLYLHVAANTVIVACVFVAACDPSAGVSVPDAASPDGTRQATTDAAIAIVPASDRFDGGSLDPSWTVLHPEFATIAVANNRLDIQLAAARLWFDDLEGVLVYKLATGNFKVSSTVLARRSSDPSSPPNLPVQLGGLMARDPDDAAHENYVFVVTGRDGNGLAVETKSTVDDHSTFDGPDWPSGDAKLRLCRIDDNVFAYKREIGSHTWLPAATFVTNLPRTLQVGPNLYAASGPDLRVTWDAVTFEPAATEADCTAD